MKMAITKKGNSAVFSRVKNKLNSSLSKFKDYVERNVDFSEVKNAIRKGLFTLGTAVFLSTAVLVSNGRAVEMEKYSSHISCVKDKQCTASLTDGPAGLLQLELNEEAQRIYKKYYGKIFLPSKGLMSDDAYVRTSDGSEKRGIIYLGSPPLVIENKEQAKKGGVTFLKLETKTFKGYVDEIKEVYETFTYGLEKSDKVEYNGKDGKITFYSLLTEREKNQGLRDAIRTPGVNHFVKFVKTCGNHLWFSTAGQLLDQAYIYTYFSRNNDTRRLLVIQYNPRDMGWVDAVTNAIGTSIDSAFYVVIAEKYVDGKCYDMMLYRYNDKVGVYAVTKDAIHAIKTSLLDGWDEFKIIPVFFNDPEGMGFYNPLINDYDYGKLLWVGFRMYANKEYGLDTGKIVTMYVAINPQTQITALYDEKEPIYDTKVEVSKMYATASKKQDKKDSKILASKRRQN